MRSHSRYLFLKRVTESLCLIFSGIEFQILDPEYESEFLYSSILGFGTYKRLLDVDLSALWCISVVCVNKSCKYWGAVVTDFKHQDGFLVYDSLWKFHPF